MAFIDRLRGKSVLGAGTDRAIDLALVTRLARLLIGVLYLKQKRRISPPQIYHPSRELTENIASLGVWGGHFYGG